jgi:hypothetical protein
MASEAPPLWTFDVVIRLLETFAARDDDAFNQIMQREVLLYQRKSAELIAFLAAHAFATKSLTVEDLKSMMEAAANGE